MAAVALEATFMEGIPNIARNDMLTVLVMPTRNRLTGSAVERIVLGTPAVAALGKSTDTVSFDPLKPFSRE
jgi:hypothetical protein